MRYKIVPEPLDWDGLLEARDALPLVPGTVEDCCTRIRDGTPLQSRDAARELLTFLQALGLAAESDRGFHRVRGDVTDDDLRAAFVENVFGARELRDALLAADEPLTADDGLDVLREQIPGWERARYPDWEAEWGERVDRLLTWATVFGLADSVDGAYRVAER
jgi:hypothetical protein